mmetsp:Transcript_3483/g.6440  ORF Transcript_3483/g.6440 Transcript_3483/m.6440 type:complete len:203 (-) Transcript_3483:235-843(-)|eukprot:CAMPEP_0113310492 /NCGR_PEP_ID=MMETSP0010_2-20120614/8117_1 /TAXON_ID=216773 ORGANISM="Corethron hystrix, Strain 308" /NCGR_SAMPLE_ID=MMETSP0010_2 /ASSEMBLY_ACC=CAM_ASM_000155 /LENGTH=202 /DNA_ID=CAMNT_0000165961 /DNA_START=49 /DNA_END=657 /DNA_ORIENTATION=- /assembly_acc=CAM_ASM_000155
MILSDLSQPRQDIIASFIAGTVLSATIVAYFHRHNDRRRRRHAADPDDDEDDDDDHSGEWADDDADDVTQMGPNRGIAENWGVKDGPYKMILCVNKSIPMKSGKIAAQCCHAAVGCYQLAKKKCPAAVRAWDYTGCAKVAVKCPTEEEMYVIMERARERDIPTYLVCDAGRTQIAAGSRTVLGLGPAPVDTFEGVTSHLKLM